MKVLAFSTDDSFWIIGVLYVSGWTHRAADRSKENLGVRGSSGLWLGLRELTRYVRISISIYFYI